MQMCHGGSYNQKLRPRSIDIDQHMINKYNLQYHNENHFILHYYFMSVKRQLPIIPNLR